MLTMIVVVVIDIVNLEDGIEKEVVVDVVVGGGGSRNR